MNGQEAQVALHGIHEIFRRHSLTAWLDCGTLLGAVREGTFIPWDNDIDLGMWIDNLDAAEKKDLWHDFSVRDFNIYLLADKLILERREVPINISLFYKDGDRARRATYPCHTNSFSKAIRVLWWVAHARRQTSDVSVGWARSVGSVTKRLLVTGYGRLPGTFTDWIEPKTLLLCKAAGCAEIEWSVPLRYFTALEQMSFLDDQWSAPMNREEYLEFRFGPDWRVPKRNFSTLLEDGAVQR